MYGYFKDVDEVLDLVWKVFNVNFIIYVVMRNLLLFCVRSIFLFYIIWFCLVVSGVINIGRCLWKEGYWRDGEVVVINNLEVFFLVFCLLN